MGNAISNVSAALSYDTVETMLAEGFSLAACYALVSTAVQSQDAAEMGPESAKTVLSSDSATIAPRK